MPMKEPEVVEIADICMVLDRLGRADVLDPFASKACLRGSYLLMLFRVTILSGKPDKEIVEKLRDILAKNQEG